MLRFAVLGPLEASDAHGPVNLKGLRHRAVLARLVIAKGQVVPVARLIDDLWDEAPEGARGAVQTFVGALRAVLEPGRPPRTPAQVLVTASPGYALRVGPEAVDAWRFEAAVAASTDLLAGGRFEQAHSLLVEAEALWRGPAYAEFAEHDWARVEAARLEAFRLLAAERRAEAALALGLAAESVPGLETQVDEHPFREEGWRLLALALYRADRQGDALATLRRAGHVLRTELGVDPGPRLRQLEADILAHAPHLAAPPATPPTQAPQLAALPPTRRGAPPFVGRAVELATLEAAAAAAVTAGRPHLALVSGAAGAGKTALAETLARRLRAADWVTAWGASPELQGAPDAWPWSQMRERLPGPALSEPAAGEDPIAARFTRQRAIGACLATIREPVLLVFDDLHWADEETLALVTALAADRDAGAVLIVGTYRSDEIGGGLADALGRAARAEPTRISLEGMSGPEVRELVGAISTRQLEADAARAIHRRSAGNPFFVRELTRLWETDGDAALHAVPAGVRDVIRQRLTKLPEAARTHLHQAAVLGQEVELDVLIGLAGDEGAVLEAVESGVRAGFLVEHGADRVAFAHALVHETLYDDTSRARRAGWHAAAAERIERLRPADVEAIAHHLLRAEGRAPAERTARFARAAAQRAAPQEAARLWRETLAAVDRSGSGDTRVRLEAVMGMVRALAVTGDLEQARRHRDEAIVAAEAVGDPVLTAEVIGAFDVPAIWTTNDDEALSARVVAAAERTLALLPADRQQERARLLITIAMERRADAGALGDEAAREAEALARDLADPALLAFALNGRFMQTFHRAGLAPERARIGEELVALAARHGLVTFEVLGHLILIGASAALADLDAADRHARAADDLAERYGLPVVAVFTEWYAALRLAIAGSTEDARTAYRKAAARLTGTGMSGLERGLLPLALLSLESDWSPDAPWAHGAARGLLLEVRTCLHAMAAIEAGDEPVMEHLYAQLLPAGHELAGAGSGLLTLGPAALYLGRLATALGRPGQAAAHHRQALAVAERARAPHWATAARALLESA